MAFFLCVSATIPKGINQPITESNLTSLSNTKDMYHINNEVNYRPAILKLLQAKTHLQQPLQIILLLLLKHLEL